MEYLDEFCETASAKKSIKKVVSGKPRDLIMIRCVFFHPRALTSCPFFGA